MSLGALRVNNSLYSWSSSILIIGVEPFTLVTKLEFGEKRERVYGWGMGRHHAPIGRSAGKYTPDPVKMTIYAHAEKELLTLLGLLSGTGLSYGNAIVPIRLQLVEPDLTPLTYTLDRCCISEIGNAYEESPENIMVDVTWSTMGVYRNKRTMFDITGGLP